MDAESKLIPPYAVGRRDRETTYQFLADLRDRIAEEHRFQLTTDGFVFYRRGVEDLFAGQVAGDELDDIADMMRYAMLTWFETSSKPREIANQQKLEEYRAKGMDEYSLNIYRCRMEREDRQAQEQPVYLGRQHGRILIRR
jgi:hypothetical protein